MDKEPNEEKKSVAAGVDSSEKGIEGGQKKKHRRRLWVILGTIVLVLIVAGIGGVIWHESPTFCNAICHEPMDSYVQGYYSDDTTLLVTAHAAEGDACLDCHKASIGDQINELGVYLSGNYKTPLAMTKIGTRDFCLRECHDSEEIKTATSEYNGTARNPHNSHYGDAIECYTCHRVHRTSVMYCNECHPDISGPAGWE